MTASPSLAVVEGKENVMKTRFAFSVLAGLFLGETPIPAGAPSFTETWACIKLKRGVTEVFTAHGERKP